MSKMVGIENTTNKGGGACYEIEELQNQLVRHVIDKRNILMAEKVLQERQLIDSEYKE
jgi:hypothetical protein